MAFEGYGVNIVLIFIDRGAPILHGVSTMFRRGRAKARPCVAGQIQFISSASLSPSPRKIATARAVPK
jgi:hypothetical protein